MSSESQKNQAQPEFRYDAFISYRHLEPDRGWAKWLHTQLETYTLPPAIQKKLNLPARLERVFRDEEELPVSSSLSAQIDQALAQSRFLIVICSTNTPESKWVNQEIVRFREMGRHDRILALLIDGEPADAFPPALCEIRTELVDQESGETKVRIEEVEPLAADVRPSREEKPRTLKQMALLRILAMLHGCRFDDLRQRHQERSHRRMRQLVASALALVVVMAGLAAYAFIQQREATAQRNIAEARDFDSRSRLSSLLVAEGWRHIDANNNHLALPYFVRAFIDDPREEAEKSVHRIRIGSVLAHLPQLSGVRFSDDISYLGVLPDGMHAVVKDDDSLGIYSFELEEIVHRVSAPPSFRPFSNDPGGEYVVGVNTSGQTSYAQVVRLTDGEIVMQAKIDPKVSRLFALPARLGQYLPQAAAVVLAGHFGSSGQLYIASANQEALQGGYLQAFAVAPNDARLAFVDRAAGNIVQFRDLRTQKLLPASLELPRFTSISDLAWSSDGRFLAVVDSGQLWVYRLSDDALLAQSRLRVYGVFDVFFSADNTMLAVRGVNGTEVVTPDSELTGGMRSLGVSRVAPWDGFNAQFAFDDNLLINGSLEAVQLQRINQGLDKMLEIQSIGMPIAATISDLSGDEIRLQRAGQITSWRLLNQSFGRLPINPQGTLPKIVSVDDSSRVMYLDIVSGKLFSNSEVGPRAVPVPLEKVQLTALSKSGRRLALADRKGRVAVVDQHNSNATIYQHQFAVPPTRLEFASDEQLLVEVTGPADTDPTSELHHINLSTGTMLWSKQYQTELKAVVMSPDDKHLFVATNTDTVVVLDAMSGEKITEIEHDRVLAMHASGVGEDARMILNSPTQVSVHSADGNVMRSTIDVPVFSDFVAATALPIGTSNRLVGEHMGKDSHLRLFDLTNGKPLGPKLRLVAQGDEKIERFAVSNGGELIVAVGDRGTIQVWSGEDGSVVALPFQVALSEFTLTGSFASGGDIRFSAGDQAVAITLGNGLTVRGLKPANHSKQDLQLLAEAMSMHQFDPELGLERLPMDIAREHFKTLGKRLQQASRVPD